MGYAWGFVLLLASLIALFTAVVVQMAPPPHARLCDELQRSLALLENSSNATHAIIGTAAAEGIHQYLTLCAGSLVLLYTNASVDVRQSFNWTAGNLTIASNHAITIGAGVIITNYGNGTLRLMSGAGGDDDAATVSFADTSKIYSPNEGALSIYYNPKAGDGVHKYRSPSSYYGVIDGGKYTALMWVNSADDLKDIRYCLYCSYAISKSIDLLGEPIMPIFAKYISTGDVIPFSGLLDGNSKIISNLRIDLPLNNKSIGLFSFCSGSEYYPAVIRDLTVTNAYVAGEKLAGTICGKSQYTSFEDITLNDVVVRGNLSGAMSGSLIVGTAIRPRIAFKKAEGLNVEETNQNLIAGVSLQSRLLLSSRYASKRLFGETLPGAENDVTFYDDG